jgi:hypothetical protein
MDHERELAIHPVVECVLVRKRLLAVQNKKDPLRSSSTTA